MRLRPRLVCRDRSLGAFDPITAAPYPAARSIRTWSNGNHRHGRTIRRRDRRRGHHRRERRALSEEEGRRAGPAPGSGRRRGRQHREKRRHRAQLLHHSGHGSARPRSGPAVPRAARRDRERRRIRGHRVHPARAPRVGGHRRREGRDAPGSRHRHGLRAAGRMGTAVSLAEPGWRGRHHSGKRERLRRSGAYRRGVRRELRALGR